MVKKIALGVAMHLILLAPVYGGDPFIGARIYSEHCAQCHGANGKAIIAGTPDFLGTFLLAKPDTQIQAVIETGSGIMPAFSGILKDQEMKDVIAYIRTIH